MDLYLFRLSLKEKEADLFSYPLSAERETWLRRVFSREHQFRHYGKEFIFWPETTTASPDARLLFGWIGREKRIPERTPPDQGFQPTEHLGWQAALVIVDPTDHADGQKVAIEDNPEIGTPRAILASLVHNLNRDSNSPYFIQSFPILAEGSFWEFAKAHRNEIISLTFDVAVPNMFDGVSDFERELKALEKNENVSEVKTTLNSDGLLKPDTPRMEAIVNYVEKGAGELSAEASDGAIYKSKAHERHILVNVEHHSKNIVAFWREIRNWLDRVFP